MVNQWLKLTKEDQNTISKRVAFYEKATSAEIVPVIVRRSMTIGHVKWQLGTLLLLVLLVLQVELSQFFWQQNLNLIGAFSLVLAAVLTKLFAPIGAIQRLLTSNSDEAEQVIARAELEFYRSNIQKTEGSTGVLIFVSWLERRAVILADKAVMPFLSQELLDETTAKMSRAFRGNQFKEGFLIAIDMLGEKLSLALPAKNKNPNELPNELVIKSN